MTSKTLDALVRAALLEDIGPGDFTTEWTLPKAETARAVIVAKQQATIAGLEAFRHVFTRLDPKVELTAVHGDGAQVENEMTVIELSGLSRSLLTGERVALNFLGRLSGIATLTRRFVEEVEGTAARIIDTRKTTPGWRSLEKDAVKAGGGANHRHGLYDMVLIKDNHIAAAGGIAEAIESVRRKNARGLLVECEVSDMGGLDEALRAGVDRILLDNMTPAQVREAVLRVRAAGSVAPKTEASGNMSLDTVRAYAEAGVDYISVGALTHSAPSADFSMRVQR